MHSQITKYLFALSSLGLCFWETSGVHSAAVAQTSISASDLVFETPVEPLVTEAEIDRRVEGATEPETENLAQSNTALTKASALSIADLVPSVAQPAYPIALPIESGPQSSMQLVLRLSDRRVYLFKEGLEVASYPVAVGKAGWETPQGKFEVMQKIPDPVWQHPWNGTLVGPGPRNPLGRRWLGFASKGSNLYGFHGTIDESLIGQAVSHGCVRMRNADIEALFELVEVGTPVLVKP